VSRERWRFFSAGAEEGPSSPIEGVQITLVAAKVAARLPGGGAVWLRPRGVRVRRGSEEAWVAITDPTRRMQIALFAAGAAASVAIAVFSGRKR
jgi:hypothetical protein